MQSLMAMATVVPMATSWSDFLTVLNSAGLIAITGAVMIAGMATLLFRRW
jgi:hypothetical protein